MFPVFFQQVLKCGVNDKTTDDYRSCMLQLQQAIDVVLRGHEPRKKDYLMRRACRVHNVVTASYRDERIRVEKMGMMALYCLQRVLEADYLVLEEGSNLAAAIEAVVRGLEDSFVEEKLDASARKQALKLLQTMQDEGYFVGVNTKEKNHDL